MKALFFTGIFLPLFSFAQGYAGMSVMKTQKPALHVTASLGYQYKHIATEAKMYVPVTNQNDYPAYFVANGGYIFYLSPALQITPLIGYGYALESNDNKELNKWVKGGFVRLTYNWLAVEAGVIDNKPFIGIGVMGFLN